MGFWAQLLTTQHLQPDLTPAGLTLCQHLTARVLSLPVPLCSASLLLSCWFGATAGSGREPSCYALLNKEEYSIGR